MGKPCKAGDTDCISCLRKFKKRVPATKPLYGKGVKHGIVYPLCDKCYPKWLATGDYNPGYIFRSR